MTDKDTHPLEGLLEAATTTARLQLLTARDRELIDAVLAAFPTMSEAEAVEACDLAGGLSLPRACG
jgi:FixJ family two-component response regulator